MTAPTPAGWYPDPSGAPGQRYWDGAQWTQPRPVAHMPMSKMSKVWAWVAGIVAALAVGAWMVAGISSSVNNKTSTPTAAPAAGLNQPVRDGQFEFVVTGVYNQGYMTAHMTVRNIGNEAQTFFTQNQKLIDSAGRIYDADTAAVYDFNKSGMVDLNPGLSTESVVPFRVPEGVTITAVEVHDSAFSGGARVTVR
jgi:Domain of unknown function (DUF4352)/Protein of unknown function (DUF2510)